jgi:ABC-type dipeptide/oligopeptide/nickel transport system permease subunit
VSYSLAEMLQGNEPEFAPELVEAQIQGRTPLQLAWRRLRKDKVSMICLCFIIFLILVAIFAPLLVKLTGHPPNVEYSNTAVSINDIPVGPSRAFLLGADDLGRDVLSRIIYGARISLEVGIGATAIAVVFGLLLGLVSGYYGGRVDAILARFMDLLLAFPVLLFAIALVARFGPSLELIILVISLFQWPLVARLVRGQVISIREREFVEAARSLGSSSLRIMFLDIAPNLIALAIVYATLLVPVNIVLEATLSFLGLGIQPPTASWGNMIAEAQVGDLYTIAWWFLVFPCIALFLTTLAFNLLGDGLRDALDPRQGRTQIG